jgi:hypothetical protein
LLLSRESQAFPAEKNFGEPKENYRCERVNCWHLAL